MQAPTVQCLVRHRRHREQHALRRAGVRRVELESERGGLASAGHDLDPFVDPQAAHRLRRCRASAGSCSTSDSLPAAAPCPARGGRPTQRSPADERQLRDAQVQASRRCPEPRRRAGRRRGARPDRARVRMRVNHVLRGERVAALRLRARGERARQLRSRRRGRSVKRGRTTKPSRTRPACVRSAVAPRAAARVARQRHAARRPDRAAAALVFSSAAPAAAAPRASARSSPAAMAGTAGAMPKRRASAGRCASASAVLAVALPRSRRRSALCAALSAFSAVTTRASSSARSTRALRGAFRRVQIFGHRRRARSRAAGGRRAPARARRTASSRRRRDRRDAHAACEASPARRSRRR